MDTAQWAQGNIGVVKPMDLGSVSNPKPPNPNPAMLERKARPQKDQALNCPRCNSTNTKFCYYNNYSLSQPRYFCKTCRRYWTEGGSLRNVPVGGGSRKNKRPSSSSSSSTSAPPSSPSPASASSPSTISKKILEPSSSSQNPKIIHQGQDLNLAYPPPPDQINPIPTTSSRGLNLMSSLMPMSVSADGSLVYDNSNNNGNHNNSGGGFIPLQEFKPHQGLSFSFEGFENNGYGGGLQGMQLGGSGGARMLFPVEDLKHVPSTTSTTNTNTTHHEFDQHNNRGGGHGDSSGFWSGMLGGGSW